MAFLIPLSNLFQRGISRGWVSNMNIIPPLAQDNLQS